MANEKDLYFPPGHEEYAVERMRNAELRMISDVWVTTMPEAGSTPKTSGLSTAL